MFECVERVQNVKDLFYVGFVYEVHECMEEVPLILEEFIWLSRVNKGVSFNPMSIIYFSHASNKVL